MDGILSDYRAMVIYAAAHQLGIKLDPLTFDLRKVQWDNSRYRLAIEFYNQALPPIRFRIYIRIDTERSSMTAFTLFEDPNYNLTPYDEVYVGDGFTTPELYSAIVDYLRNDSEAAKYSNYDIILVDGESPLITAEGDYVLY